MTNATLTPEIALLREEIVPHLTKNMRTLFDLSTDPAKDQKEALRLAYKATAIKKVIRDQGERLQNVTTENDVLTIVRFIQIAVENDKDMAAGTELAVQQILGYLR
jgi:hypothetical protein